MNGEGADYLADMNGEGAAAKEDDSREVANVEVVDLC